MTFSVTAQLILYLPSFKGFFMTIMRDHCTTQKADFEETWSVGSQAE